MTAVHFGTFDAERWWRPDDLAALPAVPSGAEAAIATMDEVLIAGCRPGDLLVTRRALSPAVRRSFAEAGLDVETAAAEELMSGDAPPAAGPQPVERLLLGKPALAVRAVGYGDVCPYAVLPDTASLLAQWGRKSEVPRPDTVARVNSKAWSNALVCRLGLPGRARLVRSADELCAAVAAAGGPVLVKDPFGVSGNGILQIGAPGALRAIERVLRRQEEAGRRVELLVQPELPKRRDFSAHLEIARDGDVHALGVQTMTNHGFRHLGSGPADPELAALLDRVGYWTIVAEVAAALSAEGYWGLVGIDSLLLDDGSLVPVLEINARNSMGRLALLAGRHIAREGLACQLWQIDVTLSAGQGIDAIVSTLRHAGLLYEGGSRAGILVLSCGALSPSGGRLYGLSFCAAEDARALLERAMAEMRAGSLRPRLTGRAA